MPGRVLYLLLLVLPCAILHGAARAEDISAEALLRAVQEKVERAVKDAGPSLARIYVSRSDAYANAPYWGETRDTLAGDLGRFDAATARKKVPEEARNRSRILRTIAEHDLSDPKIIPESYGSGMVVGKGLILTCAHVVRNATRVYVRLPGKRGSWANIHAADPRSDLAVLRLLDPPNGMSTLPMGKGENVRKGQFIIGMANGFAPRFRRDDEPTASHGTIVALRRLTPDRSPLLEQSRKSLHQYGTVLQVDARTATGCSGGVLLDLDGKAVGLTTAMAGITGGSSSPPPSRFPGFNIPRIKKEAIAEPSSTFAIPFNVNIRRIVDVLKRGEEVEYGFLGVALSTNDGRRDGAYLERVTLGSPAYHAGLRQGDVLRSINGNAVTDNNDVFLYIGMALAGTKVRIEVLRDGNKATFTAKLAKYHVSGPVIAAKRPPARFGLRVDYNSVLAQRNILLHRWPADGVAIREVVPGSPADKARLQPDKLITHVNGRAVSTPAEYYDLIARAGNKVEITYLTSNGRPDRLTLEEK